MKIGFTGTQRGMSPSQLIRLARKLVRLEATEFHHGDCIGADEQAHNLARALGLRIIIHPPNNDSKRAFCQGAYAVLDPLPYLVRNQVIVDQTEQLLGTPGEEEEQLRSGTWSTIRYAVKTHKPFTIIGPDKTRKVL